MFMLKTFKAKIAEVNSHYERFFNSRLHSLVTLLERTMPVPSASEVRTELLRIQRNHPKGFKKYRRALDYLVDQFPGLNALWNKSMTSISLGVTTQTYAPGKWYTAKDRDGNFHSYIMQERGNSCGCACVKIVKTARDPRARDMSEEVIQRQISLQQSGAENTGQDLLSVQTALAHDWETTPDSSEAFEYALHRPPFAVQSAQDISSATDFYAQLSTASTKYPAMAGWLWSAGGGHMTVCVGPTSDGADLIVLDPWNGLQYVPNDPSTYRTYNPQVDGTGVGTGTIAAVISTRPA